MLLALLRLLRRLSLLPCHRPMAEAAAAATSPQPPRPRPSSRAFFWISSAGRAASSSV
jgi:hypothetical protein